MGSRFFQKINYSASNEDSSSELEALQLVSSDHVVCITGSGARTLDLLLSNPQKIYSVDFNPAQNHLLALKLNAYTQLNYAEFIEFIGLAESNRRLTLLSTILPSLSHETRTFWRQNSKHVAQGLLYCGTWEKLLRWISKTTILRRRKIDRLWHAADLDVQREVWNQDWSGAFLKRFLRLISTRFLWTHVVREPGAKLIPSDFDVGGYLNACLQSMANHSLIRKNPYANLLFRGRYTDQCSLPLHLREKNFDTIKQLADRVEITTAPIGEFLLSKKGTIDAFSLSDFSSYAPPETYDSIWKSIVFSASENARFCERFFLIKMDELMKTPEWDQHVHRDSDLEKRIERSDHTCLYSFRAGKISNTLAVQAS